MMKKMLYTVIAVAALSVMFSACKKEKPKDYSVTGVSIAAATTSTLNVYGTGNPNTLQLTATVSPTDAEDQTLTWESSNDNFATVSQTGLVTAMNAGTVTIFAFSNDNYDIYDSVILTITRGPHPTWGAISFRTTEEWTFGEGGAAQTWSDVVLVANAIPAEDDFDAGSEADGFKVAIQKNPGKGDKFSWEAVNQLKTSLCPYPWRTPSRQDYVALDILLGGDGLGHNPSTSEHALAYINGWGGDSIAMYWSNSPGNGPALAFALQVNYGVSEFLAWAPAPNQDEPPQSEGGTAAGAGCTPANGFMFGAWQGTHWACAFMDKDIQIVTIPEAHISKTTANQLRCIR